MYLGTPEDLPIEGEEFEKCKPKVNVVISYCILSLVAHLFVQDVS